MKTIRILGTRGIPAQHGGFETFAESLALYLVSRGWNVTVYCQLDCDNDASREIIEERWRGIRLLHIPVANRGALGTIIFDWRSTLHAAREAGLVLTLGYNTAVFCVLYRLMGIVNIINMDGLEWMRKKWSMPAKTWLYINERLGCWLGNHLIADHPEIKAHLVTRVAPHKISMIPYGADAVDSADASLLNRYGLSIGGYIIVIARPEAENSILEIVQAFSQKRRGMNLVVLGKYTPEENEYHRRVVDAASSEVKFIGGVYHKPIVNALRLFARFYVHGHTVGGTNPSLVEALGAGLPVLAHDNKFNRWVAGRGAHYFAGTDECAFFMDMLCKNDAAVLESKTDSIQQFEKRFRWETVHRSYEQLLEQWSQPAYRPAVPQARFAERFSVSLVVATIAVFSMFIFMR